MFKNFKKLLITSNKKKYNSNKLKKYKNEYIINYLTFGYLRKYLPQDLIKICEKLVQNKDDLFTPRINHDFMVTLNKIEGKFVNKITYIPLSNIFGKSDIYFKWNFKISPNINDIAIGIENSQRFMCSELPLFSSTKGGYYKIANFNKKCQKKNRGCKCCYQQKNHWKKKVNSYIIFEMSVNFATNMVIITITDEGNLYTQENIMKIQDASLSFNAFIAITRNGREGIDDNVGVELFF